MEDTHNEEQILLDAVEKTIAAYREAPTVPNLREWNAAKAALETSRKATAELTSGMRFRNLSEVSRWLIKEGYKVQERTVRNHHKTGLFPVQPGGEFRQADIEAYAKNHLDRPGYSDLAAAGNSSKDRIQAALAEEREFRTSQLKGRLIDAAEEEARDAKLWKAVRSDIEQQAPAVITELVERIIGLDPPEELRHRITALIPELRVTYEDFIAEMFDRYAKAGGIFVD